MESVIKTKLIGLRLHNQCALQISSLTFLDNLGDGTYYELFVIPIRNERECKFQLVLHLYALTNC